MQDNQDQQKQKQGIISNNSYQGIRALARQQSMSLAQHQSIGQLHDLYRPDYGVAGRSEIQNEKLWELMAKYESNDIESIQKSIVHHVECTLCKNRFTFQNEHCYQAVAYSLRDRVIESFNDTQQYLHSIDSKRVYYLSLEFLIGRALQNTIVNMHLEKSYKDALMQMGYTLETLYEEEIDPALGNGGLGRLAACFLDSLATLNYPAWGYGIRYNYGIFQQKIINGAQVEVPDYWLRQRCPWEIERNDVKYPVRFYGNVRKEWVEGKERSVWENGEIILAEAYDTPMPGYHTQNCINLRLWKSIPTNEFDFYSFNKGDYHQAIESRQRAEYISSVLYPNDSSYEGKELRLKQQYFFICATLQDVIRRFKKNRKRTWDDFPKQAAIQLNDTHPALAIVELLRILIDEEKLEPVKAFKIIYDVFSYTNHTVLPEALEKWDITLMGNLLPRHLEIIYLINHVWLEKVQKKYPGNFLKTSVLSLIEETTPKKIRMANLCIVGSHCINGVAELHTQLLKETIFKDFYEMNPDKFQNKTNGVTPRRWIRCSNPWLSEIYDKWLESADWVADLEKTKSLVSENMNGNLHKEWILMKKRCKQRLKDWVLKECKIQIPLEALYDVQVKRIHEYKRQFMNALWMIHRYLQLKNVSNSERKKFLPRVCFVGGKAAPGYLTAKRIIKLVNAIGNTINNDKNVSDFLKVVFLPNYNVSNAQVIIPAAELSQHISTAGTEASGTSNMKFAMNGCLIIGTMDGANVEIVQEIGEENMFIFGARVNKIEELRLKMRNSPPDDYIPKELKEVFAAIESGMFGHVDELKALIDTIRFNNDHYLVCADFLDYCETQKRVDQCYTNQEEWQKRSISSACLSSKFSSDRTIIEYARDIWNIDPKEVPQPLKSKEQTKEQRKSQQKLANQQQKK